MSAPIRQVEVEAAKAKAAACTATSLSTLTSNSSSSSSSSSSSGSVSEAHARILNINVGVLGHVDSGKTSLSKALSTHLSTAALDKLPQSQQRGITLDLGFSAFFADLPAHIQGYDRVQFTLVDCPGHARLIRTIVGGAQIIDVMLLVIDITKGIQTQTAECLVIGEIVTNHLIVVLNKCDLMPDPEKRAKVEKGLRNTFKATKFGADVPMVYVSANPGSSDDLKIHKESKKVDESSKPILKPEIQPVIDALVSTLSIPSRGSASSFYFAIDHCFPIKGQGTVLTGTILSGTVNVGQQIELPELKLERKVKSMQMFHRPVEFAVAGDRVGICVTQVDSTLIERGIACAPGSVASFTSIIGIVDKIRFHKQTVASKGRFHVTIGHTTCMATVLFFGHPRLIPAEEQKNQKQAESDSKDAHEKTSVAPPYIPPSQPLPVITSFDMARDYTTRDQLYPISAWDPPQSQYAVITFDRAVTCPLSSIVIGSRLDTDIHMNTCRLAFSGRLLQGIDMEDAKQREQLRIYTLKERSGVIDRMIDECTLIGRDLFSRGADMHPFIGLKIFMSDGTPGYIESSFGKGGKFKVRLQQRQDGQQTSHRDKTTLGRIYLRHKKYIHAIDKKAMIQT